MHPTRQAALSSWPCTHCFQPGIHTRSRRQQTCAKHGYRGHPSLLATVFPLSPLSLLIRRGD